MSAERAGLQLRRAISIQAEGKNYLRSMLSRRQLQGFVRLRFLLLQASAIALLYFQAAEKRQVHLTSKAYKRC